MDACSQVGTSVIVEDVFGRLPLRRRTMEQTKQRQLQDALALIQRIALLHATTCRMVFSNFDSKMYVADFGAFFFFMQH